MRCKHCGAYIESYKDEWIHRDSNKFRCDGEWFTFNATIQQQAEPDYFKTYLEQVILCSYDTKLKE